ncbi:MAG: hypothetical protein ABEI11_03920 [Haloarculaceae archaeon]
MADLSPGSPREAGQLMLIGALSLAIVLVALTLLVNSAIYTQTVATRGAGPTGGSDAVGFRSGVDRGVTDTIEFVNDNEVGYDNQTEQLRDSIPNVSDAMGIYAAERGRSVSVSYATQENGTRIERASDGQITDYNVSGVETRAFVVDIDRPSFPPDADASAGPPPDPLSNVDAEYRIDFEGAAGDTVQVAVLRDDDASPERTLVAVYLNGDLRGFCTDDTGTRTRIDIDDAHVADEYCLPLEFFDLIETPVTVRFVDGTVSGLTAGESQYEYVVDATNTSTTVTTHPSGVTNTAVLYSVRVDLTYRTPELRYDARARIVPEAPDE